MNGSHKGTFVEITTREVLINGEPVMVEKGTLNVTMGGLERRADARHNDATSRRGEDRELVG